MTSAAKLTTIYTYPVAMQEWLARMPTPPKGSHEADMKNKLQRDDLLKVVITGVTHQDLACSLEVHKAFQDYLVSKASQYHHAAIASAQFQHVTCVIKCDEKFLLAFMRTKANLTPLELKTCVARTGALEEMVEAEFQLSPSLKMKPELQIRGVMTLFLNTRSAACRTPLSNMKANGGVAADGTLCWKNMTAYTPEFDVDGKITHITHRLGDKIEVSCPFTKDSMARYIWSDWRACFPNSPHKEVKLHLYFKKEKKGPYAHLAAAPDFHFKSKEYDAAVELAFTTWKIAQAAAVAGSLIDTAAHDIKQARDDAASASKRKILDAARTKGAAALKKRRESSDVKFD
jgi:hypothetical protein